MPQIASRDRDSGLGCPRCGASVTVREITASRSPETDETATWVVASRFCSAGCVLLSSDLSRLARQELPDQLPD